MIKQKGILFILPRLYPCDSGGVELFHYYFTKKISKYYNILIITFCNSYNTTKNIKIINFNRNKLLHKTLSKIYYGITTIYKNRRHISLIHIPYSSKSIFQDYHLVILSKLFRIPYILRIHGGGMHAGKPRFMHQALFDNASGIIAVSTPVKKEYEKRHGRSITVIPSMLPFKKSKKRKSDIRKIYDIEINDIIILFLGSIKPIKGPDILLKAFFSLGKEYIQENRLKLFYVGDGEIRKNLKKEAESSDLRYSIRFFGNVPHEQICDFYKMSDIFIIPSYMEARPLSLSEAKFHGIAIIGSDIITIKNLIKNKKNGLLFKSRNINDLKDKIKTLIENKKLRKELGKEAEKTYNESYSYNEMVRQYLLFYDDIIYRD